MASAAQEEKGKEEISAVKMEVKTETKEEEDKNEQPKKVVASIWELLMQSKIHRDAMVQALYERKVLVTLLRNSWQAL